MTKTNKFGGTVSDLTVEGAEHLEKGEGIRIDSDTSYDTVGEFEAKSEPLIDPGTGKPIAIRVFEFKMNPLAAKTGFPDNQTLFNAHAKQISTILWGDGLSPVDNIPPRVIIDKERLSYRILVTCEGRLGVSFIDKPRNLTEVLKNSTAMNEPGRRTK